LTALLDTHQLAALADAPADPVRYWRSQGSGPRFAKFGKRILYRRDDVEQSLRRNTATPITLTAAGSLITLTLPEIENVYRFALNAAHLRRYAAPPTDEPNWVE
jgi:hypothetical protein